MSGEVGVVLTPAGAGLDVRVGDRAYRMPRRDHDAWLDLHAQLAADRGTRMPLNRRPAQLPAPTIRLEPVLTEAVDPEILYGFGDPCVLHAPEEGAWYLIATSNDAPQSFPILKSADLKRWELVSFAFPQGASPPGASKDWAAPTSGRRNSTAWAGNTGWCSAPGSSTARWR